MARQSKEAYDLSDAEKRDLIQLIEQGRPLPEQYRFVLFEDEREVESVWNRKHPRGLHHRAALPVAGAGGRAARRDQELP